MNEEAIPNWNAFAHRRIPLSHWINQHATGVLRLSLCVIFVWFGALKFFPGLSPAEALAGNTIETLTFGYVRPHISLPLLGCTEVLLGLGLMWGRAVPITTLLLLGHMVGAASPILVSPELVFAQSPFVLTLEGQYIVKNLIIITATLVIAAQRRSQ